MRRIKCMIVEDELPSAQELVYMLRDYSDLTITDICRDGMEALEVIGKRCPEVVFLDINIPKIDGIELANKIKEMEVSTNIIFTTAYHQHAIKAFEIDAVDYLLKPFDANRISKTVKRIRERVKQESNEDSCLAEQIKVLLGRIDREKSAKKLPIHINDRIILVDIADICYCYIEGEKTYAKLWDKLYFTRYTLAELEEKTGYFRCHKSFLVNTKKILELYPWFNGSYQLAIADKENSQLPLSRSNVKRLKALIGI